MGFINTNIGTTGRFANQFFRNLVAHFISRIYDLHFTYSNLDKFTKLGFQFYNGNHNYKSCQIINNRNFMNIINYSNNSSNTSSTLSQSTSSESALSQLLSLNITSPPLKTITPTNIDLSTDFFQTREFAFYIRRYILQDEIKNNIINANPYKERYDNNSDIFIHIRLDDARKFAPSFDYFDKVISLHLDTTQPQDIYITSDSINDPICKKLIAKYNMKIFKDDEVATIQFASTCKTLILSNGTFSWMMGLLAFHSTVNYPKIKLIWHGDIFVFPDWIEY